MLWTGCQLLLVVGWITVTRCKLSKFNLCKLQCIQNSAARIVSITRRYTRVTPVFKKLNCLPVERHLFISFYTLVFPSILFHMSLPTTVLTVPGAVRLVVTSLSFHSSNDLFINLSNSLLVVLLLMAALFGMLCLMRFVSPPP